MQEQQPIKPEPITVKNTLKEAICNMLNIDMNSTDDEIVRASLKFKEKANG